MTKHITAAELVGIVGNPIIWRKSKFSGSGNNCVEFADLTQTHLKKIAIRDSKDPDGPVLLVSPEASAAFVAFAATFPV
ncbi:DUF397 domain-containing protein [Kitasatospora sp. NPDC056184]|uniref:DUF397 domain-containing protein n=1 Tax=Kitasatospora sp. NPDC056184 TaxID=3345738 RepID=UPI0035D61621